MSFIDGSLKFWERGHKEKDYYDESVSDAHLALQGSKLHPGILN